MQNRVIDWNSSSNYDLIWGIIGAILFGLLFADFIWIYYKISRKDSQSATPRMKAENKFMGCMLDNPRIDFVGLAKAEGCDGIRVERAADLRPALKQGIEATRAGTPFLVDVEVARIGGGAASTWFQKFSLAQTRKRKV